MNHSVHVDQFEDGVAVANDGQVIDMKHHEDYSSAISLDTGTVIRPILAKLILSMKSPMVWSYKRGDCYKSPSDRFSLHT